MECIKRISAYLKTNNNQPKGEMEMPKLMNSNMDKALVPGSSFNYSFIRPENLGATEYTLGTIVVDISQSVEDFKDELSLMIKTAVKACQKNPRAENMLLRVVKFNSIIEEIHGFIPLSSINLDDYLDLDCRGMTALHDSIFESIGATLGYAETLNKMDFDVNAINYIITDGWENASRKANSKMISDLISKTKKEEFLESILNILIGINSGDARIFAHLENLKNEVKMDKFLEVKDASPNSLAKLSGFISQSYSSQSQSLGSGGPSQLLSF